MSTKLNQTAAAKAKAIIAKSEGGWALEYRGGVIGHRDDWEIFGFAPPPGWTMKGWSRAMARFKAVAGDRTHGHLILPFSGMIVVAAGGVQVFRTYTG